MFAIAVLVTYANVDMQPTLIEQEEVIEQQEAPAGDQNAEDIDLDAVN